jgi:hypothetical protein
MSVIRLLIFLAILVRYCIIISASCRSGDFLHILTRFSGCCADLIDENLIIDDIGDTIEFFNTQFKLYSEHPVIVCKLGFALQCIKDYHGPVEHIFGSIDQETVVSVQAHYAGLIDSKVKLLGDQSICNAVRVGDQSNTDSSNDYENSLEDGTELGLRSAFQAWLSRKYRFRNRAKKDPAGEKLEIYQIMKVAILEHAVSLVLRGEQSRNAWRSFAAESMFQLSFKRFLVWEAVC